MYTSEPKSLYIGFLHSVKCSGYKMGIKFNKDPLAVEWNNSLAKVVNDCIVIIYILSHEILLTISN